MECSSLTEVSIGDNVTTIGDYVFQNCKALTTVTIGNSVTNVGNYMFNGCTALSSINIPNSVTSIGSYAFAGCSQLSTAIIGNGVMTIGPYAFQNCTNLSSISIGTNVKNINNFAFYGCTALSSIEIPNSVTTIGNNTFNGCSSLTSVIIGTSINSIGLAAFANCTELSDVFCYNEVVPTAQTSAFNDSYIEYATLHVIASAYENYRTTEPWSGFGTIVIIDGETPVVEKCATPTITYANGKVRFACETEGVEYVPTVTVTPNQLLNGNELALGGAFTVSVYAVKEGYDNSDTATMTINMAQMGDVNADGQVTIADVTSLVNAILGK